MSENPCIAAAEAYAARGWKLLPTRGKVPLIADWRNAPQDFADWFARWPDANVGLVLGECSGVVRLDADGEEALAMAAQHVGGLETAEFTTQSGGRGWLFAWQVSIGSSETLWKGDGQHRELRIQSTGAMTIVPPSVGYQWVREQPILPLPPALLAAVLNKRAERTLQLLPTAAPPDRDDILAAVAALSAQQADDRDTWLKVGFALHSAGDEYRDAWIEWSRKSLAFKEGECEVVWARMQRGRVSVGTLFHHAKEAGYKPRWRHSPLTDVGNSLMLARGCEGRAKYVAEWESWIAWDGARWNPLLADKKVEAMFERLVDERRDRAVKSLGRNAQQSTDEEIRKFKASLSTIQWCKQSGMRGRISAAVYLTENKEGVAVSHEVLNRRPWLLNCPNGTVNLANGELREHSADDMLTQMCPTEYRPEAICPRWDRFLSEVFPGDAELVLWFQKLLGYCLTGFASEHILPVWHGSGANGKSTVIRALHTVLGRDYTAVAPSKFIAATKSEQHLEKFMCLYGARFVTEQETGDQMRMDEELVKKLTGGDRIRARRMFENGWEFEPTHKLVIVTNHQPLVSGVDTAVWRRIKLVPFTQCFEGRKDPELDSTLAMEASGILAWLVRGCLRWIAEGLGDPPAVVEATARYRSEQDTVGEFFNECYELTQNPADRLSKSAVVLTYKTWCLSRSMRPVSDMAFGNSLKRLGVEKDAGNRNYVKIKARMRS